MADIRKINTPVQSRKSQPLKQVYNRLKLPLWLANMILFSLLLIMVLLYFIMQTQRERHIFFQHTRDHTELLAHVIQLNADNALAAGEVVKKVAHTFMLNSARFIDYLDAFEPFSTSELEALAQESGLSGITISNGRQKISGPRDWETEPETALTRQAPFSHNDKSHLFTLVYRRRESPGIIKIGLDARPFELLQKQVGLEQLLTTLNNITGISYVRFNPDQPVASAQLSTRQITTGNGMIIEVSLPMNNRLLEIGFNSDSLLAREKDLWREFTLFALLLAALGALFSWLLYRYQLTIIARARLYDRRLAREREDAILGRAAAAVAHEIRNPLNALDIGLQRLELEDSGLKSEYNSLTSAMRNAVSRADSIISDLRRFAQPLLPQLKKIDITSLIADIIALYQARADAAQIKISLTANLSPSRKQLQADPILLGQALENICKNAMEAQPEGGFLKIRLAGDRNSLEITFINAGFKLEPQAVQKITEPWFTTKTRGTGLGLALVERIIKAHNGRFEVECKEPGILRQKILLPYNGC